MLQLPQPTSKRFRSAALNKVVGVYHRLRKRSPDIDLEVTRQLLMRFERENIASAEDLLLLEGALKALRGLGISQEAILTAVALFVPEHYRRVAKLAKDASAIQSFGHFVVTSAVEGSAASPLFHDEYYLEQASRHLGAPVLADEPAFLHWLRHGIAHRIVPTPIFNEEYYLETYPDVAAAQLWGFEHFVTYGVIESRRPNAFPIIRVAHDAGEEFSPRLPEFYRAMLKAMPDDGRQSLLTRFAQQQSKFLESGTAAAIFAKAAAHEPLIGGPGDYPDSYFPPFNDRLYFYAREVQKRLPLKSYDSVICVPWIRMGGSDLVSAHIAQSLKRLKPTSRILVLLTETSHLERPEWFPRSADIVGISDLVKELSQDEAERLLLCIFIGVGPQQVFNINSPQCWSVFRRYGRQLSKEMDLFGCLFCWDYRADGVKFGYAVDYFAETIDCLKAVITDNDRFRQDLISQYNLPSIVSERIVSLCMPTRIRFSMETVAEVQVEHNQPNARPMVLWAGRLDRQKRFDLVLKIAEQMPHIDFHCWGSAVLDAPEDYAAKPPNVIMHPPFKSVEDLPLTSADVWLYTSAWDGMPNMIVELSTAGMAVVASAVGGIPELIRLDTGWPIAEVDSVDAYVAALEDALARPDERIARARKLQDLARSRHNAKAFDARLSALLRSESAQ